MNTNRLKNQADIEAVNRGHGSDTIKQAHLPESVKRP